MTASEIYPLLAAIPERGYEIINGRIVTREGGYFLIEGTKNRKFPWNVAAERLAKVKFRA